MNTPVPSIWRSIAKQLPRLLRTWAILIVWLGLLNGLAYTLPDGTLKNVVMTGTLAGGITWFIWDFVSDFRKTIRRYKRFKYLNGLAHQFNAEKKFMHAFYVLGISQIRLHKDPELYLMAKKELESQGVDMSELPQLEETD